MDQEVRNKLRNVVTQCRKLLEDSVSQELEGKYGIFAKNDQVTADPNATMTHLTEEEQVARKDLLDHFGHIKARGFKPKEALDQLVREIAFTHLNRLCAYKMMEAREVYVGGQKFREAVSRGVNSNGVKFYLADHPEEERLFNTGHQDVAYRHFLDWLGGLLSDEIGILFNPNDPANRLYPRQKTLDDVLLLLNGGGIKPEETKLREEWPKIWSQDETIGWVYQYFTPKELRDRARQESAAPRNSYELAFRNQFFTPRYVVEFLTDNTLGRIWYEMRKGDTKLNDQCRSLVRRSTELFLKNGEQPPKDAIGGLDDISQEELIKLSVHIPHRPKKDPRELKILDPACGSGHFLLYCFDLLLTIYEEAYSDPDLGPALQNDYPKLEDLRRDVPRLILAHNVHGIDIDLRCTQIAALALWLRCQRAYQETGLKKDRPKIIRANFVCAEPMPGDEQILREFVGQLEPKLLGQVVEVVFDKMKLAGEAGSLLKIEEEIRYAVAAAKQQWVRETTHATDAKGRALLFTEAEMDRTTGKQSSFDLSDLTDDQFFEKAEANVIEALRQYAEKAQNGQRLQRRLFTDDTVRGFAFVDLSNNIYDVVLMNPPFGESSKTAKSLIDKHYPHTKNDMYAAFVERGLDRLVQGGFLGAITSRTGFFLSTFQQWREELILSTAPPTVLADLGYGVLDTAMVGTAAYCLQRSGHPSHAVFFRLGTDDSKDTSLDESITAFRSGIRDVRVFAVLPGSFKNVPGSPFAYWVSGNVRRLFSLLPKFHSEGRRWRIGDHPGDNFRWLRLFWEVPPSDELREWKPYYKGADNSPYFDETRLVVDWDSKRSTYRDFYGRIGRSNERPSNYQYFELSGLTCPNSPHMRGHFAHVPSGGIFGHKSPMLQLPRELHWSTCALLNSDAYVGLLHLLMARGVEGGQTLNYEVGYLSAVPVPQCCEHQRRQLEEYAKDSFDSVRTLYTGNECSHVFRLPLLLQVRGDSLENRFAAWTNTRETIENRLQRNSDGVNEIAFAAYGIGNHDRGDLQHGLAPLNFNVEEGDSQFEMAMLVADVVSYGLGVVFGRWDLRFVADTSCAAPSTDEFEPIPPWPPATLLGSNQSPSRESPSAYPIRIEWDGIVVDDAEHRGDIVQRVRDVIDVIWANDSEPVEKEIAAILGTKGLRDYFRKSGKGGFWDYHVTRYSKSRRAAPLYWLLQSSKKNYALWLYYQRLDKDLLFKALVNYVEPKMRLETSRFETLRSHKAVAGNASKEAKRLAKDVERQEDFLSELRDFEDKLRRAAKLHLEPDLNDAVVLNIAPLWELVPWKEAKSYWDELLKGEYEWSSIGKQLRQKGLVK